TLKRRSSTVAHAASGACLASRCCNAARCARLDGRMRPSPHKDGRPRRPSLHTNLVGGGAEDFADFAGEALQGERFLQESFLGLGGGGGGEGVLSVAGEIEDFDGGAGGEKLLN